MKIVHVVSGLRGGAGVAARRLSQALTANGHDSNLICRSGSADAPDAIVVEDEAKGPARESAQLVAWMVEDAVQAGYIAPHRGKMSDTLFTLDYASIPLASHAAIAQAEIINLHWMSFFQSAESLGALIGLGKPVVWTLHDAHAFTGGCHYTAGCENWLTTCAQCPQLGGDPAGAARLRLADKVKAYGGAPNLAIVTPSVWLAGEARRSRVFANARIEAIPNAVDLSTFSPAKRAAGRRALGVGDNTICIGFSPLSRSERRKGFVELQAALSQLATRAPGKDIRLVLIGEAAADTAELPFSSIVLPVAEREAEMAEAISACDICVTPSLEDNLPNTILEAMACGAPVAAFDVGGIRDAVVDGETGLLVKVGDTAQLTDGLLKLSQDAGLRQRLGSAARTRAEKLFAPARQADAYAMLYKVMRQRTAPAAKSRPLERTRLSQGIPAEVMAQAWRPFLASVARAHQTALDHIERNRLWAEKTERNLAAARAHAESNKDWAKRNEGTLAQTKALLSKTQKWAQQTDQALASERARAEEIQAWARKSDEALARERARAEEIEEWAQTSDNALTRERARAEELQAWAQKSDEALIRERARAEEIHAWAQTSDKALRRERARAEELQAWAQKSDEALIRERARAEEIHAWAQKSDEALSQERARAEQILEWARTSDEGLAGERARAEDLHAWARKSDEALTEQSKLLDDVRAWAARSDAALTEQAAQLEATAAWAQRSEAALAESGRLLDEVRSWAAKAEASLAERTRQLEEAGALAQERAAELMQKSAQIEELTLSLQTTEARYAQEQAARTDLQTAHAALHERREELETALAGAEREINRISWARRFRRWSRALGFKLG